MHSLFFKGKLFLMNNVNESIISIKTLCKLGVVYIWGLENIIGNINNNKNYMVKKNISLHTFILYLIFMSS